VFANVPVQFVFVGRFTYFGCADADLVTICVPDMGDSITEGTILEFGVDVGEFIALDETLVTIETDKVTVEVPAPDSGVIKELLVEAGDEVEVGAPLVKLAAGEGGEPAKPKAEEPAAAAAAETTPAPTPAVEDKVR
jgi:2-oxoglutarate dehydrogenase E2 component (dihydrolipoamide succinyltransferase)